MYMGNELENVLSRGKTEHELVGQKSMGCLRNKENAVSLMKSQQVTG